MRNSVSEKKRDGDIRKNEIVFVSADSSVIRITEPGFDERDKNLGIVDDVYSICSAVVHVQKRPRKRRRFQLRHGKFKRARSRFHTSALLKLVPRECLRQLGRLR